MKKLLISTFVAASLLSACSSNVDNDGTIKSVQWPQLSDYSYGQTGTFPSWGQVKQLKQGMSKDQVMALIGHPQYDEGFFGVREWDYAFNYVDKHDKQHTCQFKIGFDKNYRVGEMYWYPADCNQPIIVDYKIDGNLLFKFDEATVTPAGYKYLQNIAKEIKGLEGESRVDKLVVTGYTDYLGTAEYNLNLSDQRAKAVARVLKDNGLNYAIKVEGKGEADQIKSCDTTLSRDELVKCLQPNRRVEIKVIGKAYETIINGTTGPSMLRTPGYPYVKPEH